MARMPNGFRAFYGAAGPRRGIFFGHRRFRGGSNLVRICRIDPGGHRFALQIKIPDIVARTAFINSTWGRQKADPTARDNAREVTVIRMAQLRSTSPLVSRSECARPRVSHRQR
jgi:hypothetical protein